MHEPGKADIPPCEVRFRGNSGHEADVTCCPLVTQSGARIDPHRPIREVDILGTLGMSAKRHSCTAASAIARFSSLGRSFGLDKFLCTRPRQLVIGGSTPRRCRPAALLQVLALLPIRRDLLQGYQVRFCVAVLQEFLHADRRERGQDGGVGPLGRKFIGGAAGHPTTPRKPDDHRCNRADCHSLQETSPRLAP